jgi:hypothetical protein
MPSQGASSPIQIDTTLVPWKTGRYPDEGSNTCLGRKFSQAAPQVSRLRMKRRAFDEACEAGAERLKL